MDPHFQLLDNRVSRTDSCTLVCSLQLHAENDLCSLCFPPS